MTSGKPWSAWPRSGRSARPRPAAFSSAADGRRSGLLVAVLVGVLLCGSAPAADVVIEDAWHLMRLAGRRVGYLHSRIVRAPGNDTPIRSIEEVHVTIRRLGIKVAVDMTAEQVEDAGGRILAFSTVTRASNLAMVAVGTVKGDKLEYSTFNAGLTTRKTFPWDPEALGPMAQQRLLLANFLEGEEGKEIVFKVLVPDMVRITRATVKIGAVEETPFLGSTRRLRRVTTVLDAMPNTTTVAWLDDKGTLVKSHVPLLGGVEIYRVSKAEALREPEQAPDLMAKFFIKTPVKFERPQRVTEVLYRLEAPPGTLANLPPEGPRQKIERRSTNSVWVRVKTVAPPAKPPTLGAASRAGGKYVRASAYVQSDDEAIIKTARAVAGDAPDQWQAARRLEQWVRENVAAKNLSIGFASARETLDSREGDCSEHAVLLAALCRALGIPSRIAVGVVYWRGIYGYHMWTEIDAGGWHALDATLAGRYVSAARIKLLDSALETGSWGGSLVGIAPLIGSLKIHVLEYQVDGEPIVVVGARDRKSRDR